MSDMLEPMAFIELPSESVATPKKFADVLNVCCANGAELKKIENDRTCAQIPVYWLIGWLAGYLVNDYLCRQKKPFAYSLATGTWAFRNYESRRIRNYRLQTEQRTNGEDLLINMPTLELADQRKTPNKIIPTRAYNSHHFFLARMVLWTKTSKFNRSSNQDGSHIHQEHNNCSSQ